MKLKVYTKRTLSLILCMVMLMTCWVFTAPGAGAAGASEYAYRIEHQDDNPVYHVEIDLHILDAGNGFNRVFKGTQTGNPDGWTWEAENYKDMGGIVIWYKDNNGTAASEKDYSIDFSPANDKYGYYHSDNTTTAKSSLFPQNSSSDWDSWDNTYYTLCLDLSGFPTAYAVYNNNDHMKFSWGWKPDTWTDFEITQIRVSGYDSSVDVTSEAYDSYRPIFTGNIRSASTDGENCSRYYIKQDGTVAIWRPNEYGDNFESNTENNWVHFSDYAAGQDAMKKGGSFNSAYTKSWSVPVPQFSDYSFTKSADTSEYYVAGEHAVFSSAYTFSNKDQYGAVLAGTLEQSFSVVEDKHYENSAWTDSSFATPSYSLNGATGEITPTKANGFQYHKYSIRPETTWIISGAYVNVNGAVNGLYYGNTKTALMNYPQQTVTYTYNNTTTLGAPVKTDAENDIYDSMGTAAVTNVGDTGSNAGYSALYGDDVTTVPAAAQYTDHYYDASGHYTAAATPFTAPGTMHESLSVSCAYGAATAHAWSAWAEMDSATEGMSASDYHRSVCTVGGETHYRYQPHDWDAGTTDTATCTAGGSITYTCNTCEQTKTVATDAKGHTPAAAVTENSSAADCENNGGYDTVVYCSVCDAQISSAHTVIPATGHDIAGVDWSSDGINHWKTCKNANCPNPRQSQSGHDTAEGESVVTKEATCMETGTSVTHCSVCDYGVESVIPIDSTNHLQTAKSVDPQENEDVGFVYMQCERCEKCWAASYNGSAYVATGEAQPNPIDVKTASHKIPKPDFNAFTDSNMGYDYSGRLSSLKIMKEAYTDVDNSYQDIRFSGSVAIPYTQSGDTRVYDVPYAVNPSKVLSGGKMKSVEEIQNDSSIGNGIVDFGYIYTQDKYMDYNPENLTIENASKMTNYNGNAGYYYQRMSVVEKNASSGTFNGNNWKGVTFHADGENGENKAAALTFNLVITMKAKNWKKLYAARPYILYKYNGIVYEIYDSGCSAGELPEGEEYEGMTPIARYSFGTVFSTALGYMFEEAEGDGSSTAIERYMRTRIFAHQSDFGNDRADAAAAEAAGINWWRYYFYETFNEFYTDYGTIYDAVIG